MSIAYSSMGEVAFVHFATRGRGKVPYLPIEVRELIFSMTFPHTAAHCHLCGAIVLVISERSSYFQVRPFKRVFSECRCMPCAAFANEVIRLTKHQRNHDALKRIVNRFGGDGGGGGTNPHSLATASHA